MAKQLQKLGYLHTKNTIFLLCDVQEKFRPVMQHFEPMIRNTKKLLNAGKILEVPLIATEQYPEKLGKIIIELDISHAVGVYPKTLFSMVVPELRNKINELFPVKPVNVVLFGLEAHVCIEQSAMDLIEEGCCVHIVADCSLSRTQADRILAYERLRQIGCFITSCESVIFKLLRDKNHPKFNEIRKLVTQPSDDFFYHTKL